MSKVIEILLKELGSDILLLVIEYVAKLLKERNDNSVDKDADSIVDIIKRNTTYDPGEL